MEESNFPRDLVVEILCRLPKKSLARFMCVCKQWHSLISDRSRVVPKTTHQGLVCQTLIIPEELDDLEASEDMKKVSSQLTFLHVDNVGNVFEPSTSPCSSSSNNSTGQNRCLIGSYNGFLLFDTHLLSDVEEYVVYHPDTTRSWCIVPPQNRETNFIGLAPDDGRHFKLVRVTHHGRNLGSQVYSSHSHEWQEPSPPSYTIPAYALPITASKGWSVFVRGALHWIWMGFLLIFHLENMNYQLVSLPSILGNRRDLNCCIWESEGSLDSCNIGSDNRSIGVWSLRRGNWSSKRNKYYYRWKAKHRGILAPPLDKTGDPILIWPFAFNDDFGIVYLVISSSRQVFSYNLATKEMKGARISPLEGFDDDIFFLAFPFLYPTQLDVAFTAMEEDRMSNPSHKTLKRRKLL